MFVVVRSGVVVVVEMLFRSDVFVVERFDEMWLRRWRGHVVVGAVVGMAWLLRCGCSKIKIAKE